MGFAGADEDHRHYRLRVVMLPWLAHGHASPFLELAKRLSRHSVLVHLVSSAAVLASLRPHLRSDSHPSVHLVDLPLPSSPLPPSLHSTKNLPSHLMPSLKHAFDLGAQDFGRLLACLRPDVLLYDFIQPWAPLAASALAIPAIQFLTTAASTAVFLAHYARRPDEDLPFPSLSLGAKENLEHFAGMNQIANGVSDLDRFFQCMDRSTGFIAVRSFREIEAKYISHFEREIGKEVVPVGPLVPDDDDTDGDEGAVSVMRWLDEKEADSVVLATFGSEYFMGEEEMREVARGLELSGLGFVWVIRVPAKEAEEVVRKEGKGLVVEGWVAQRRILAHRSVGGFLTHCGWSSVLEAMKFGVPVVALPRQLDQPANAKLVEEIGAGREVRKAKGALGMFDGEEVARGIREVVVGAEGEEVRRRAREVAAMMAKKGDEEIAALVEKMAALCEEAAKKY
ncbi:UDP-glucosyltransferase 29-like [Curcuma longa]|uniref:UDP-glucosyltransferase 29-like n=1 Tax=Curcuma longa TaxID=136217 RepID=UPI003D9F7E55